MLIRTLCKTKPLHKKRYIAIQHFNGASPQQFHQGTKAGNPQCVLLYFYRNVSFTIFPDLTLLNNVPN